VCGDDDPAPTPPPAPAGLFAQSQLGSLLLPGQPMSFDPPPVDMDWGAAGLAAPLNPAQIGLEDFSGVTFTDALNHFSGVNPGQVAEPVAQAWDSLYNKLHDATDQFRDAIKSLAADTGPDSWRGATRDAALKNIGKSQDVITDALTGARAMKPVLSNFDKLISTVHASLASLEPLYQSDLKAYPEQRDAVNNLYNHTARQIMTGQYAPGMTQLAAHNPSFDGPPPPPVGTPAAEVPGVGVGAGPPGQIRPSGLGEPAAGGGPQAPPTTGQQAPSEGGPPPSSGGSGDGGGGGSGDGGSGGSSDSPAAALPQAAAQAADDLTNGLTGSDAAGTGGPPEGILGLGPTGLSGIGSGGADPGGAGPPSGASGTARGLAERTALRPPAAAPAESTPAARAGLASGSGAAGGGAPAAGARGRGGDKVHKASDALRRTENGEEIAEEADAVPSVLGVRSRES
jgi:hypothetical protein